ncbi:hypothetical protein LOC67_07470 [Stieleria sp. JC731]|uniref:hypothetical protein n=1 Tax=Pirellulaceae TaxID=2691357 RepID=UPI001E383F0B|nr:hypothetical protein [Stieleria sp. JC731]MCC9600395.1 hypothetical protein [Stieleria sp. JC731]
MARKWVLGLALGITASVSANTVLATDPVVQQAGSGPFASGAVVHGIETGTVASRALRQVSHEVPRELIQFDIRVVQVDAETRDAIYALVDQETLSTKITGIEDQKSSFVDQDSESAIDSFHRTIAGSVITTGELPVEQIKSVLTLIRDSGQSDLVSAPRIIVAPGQTGAIQKKVQRPFLSKISEVKLDEENVSFEAGIEVLNEGIDLAVEGDWEGDSLIIRTKLQHSRVSDVETFTIHGIGETTKTLQVPTQETRLASASVAVKPGYALMLDPFLYQTEANVETQVAAGLQGVPYAKQMFGKQVAKETRTSTLVFIVGHRFVHKENAKPSAE